MLETNLAIEVMNDDDLLACTRELVRKSCGVEADLLLCLLDLDLFALVPPDAYGASTSASLCDELP